MNVLLDALISAFLGDAISDDRVVRDVSLIDHVSEQFVVDTIVYNTPRALLVGLAKPVGRKITLASPLAILLYTLKVYLK